MIVTVFRSRLMPDVREEYVALVDRMVELAATIPGYISHKGFSPKTASASPSSNSSRRRRSASGACTRNTGSHNARRRKSITKAYSVQVCQVIREARFKREPAPKTP